MGKPGNNVVTKYATHCNMTVSSIQYKSRVSESANSFQRHFLSPFTRPNALSLS
jgi:hypothetical protein